MTGLLLAFGATLTAMFVNNVWAALAAKYEFRVETYIDPAGADDLIRTSLAGTTPFQKAQGTLEHGYQRILKRGIGPYRSYCRVMVDVLPIADKEGVVVTGWIEEYEFGRQLILFADPLGPAPIWGSFKLRKVLKAIENEAGKRDAAIAVEVDHDGSLSKVPSGSELEPTLSPERANTKL